MRTDELIADLAADLKPTRNGAVDRLLGLGLAGGAAVTALLVILGLGLRPDLVLAAGGAPFWMKSLYTLLLCLIGFVLAAQAGRPAARLLPFVALIFAAVAMIALVGGMQMMAAPKPLWARMVFGGSSSICSWLIIGLSIPIVGGVLMAMRRMAPTRPMAAGGAAGVLAGAASASLYGLHCTESSALFVTVWYTLGIAGAAIIGAVCGRFVLRW